MPLDARDLRFDVIDREPLLLALPAGHSLAKRSSLRLAEVAVMRLFRNRANSPPRFTTGW